MLSSGVTIAINPASWFDDSSDSDVTVTETGSPLDSYSLEEQPQFCGTSEKAKKIHMFKNLRYLHHVPNLLQ